MPSTASNHRSLRARILFRPLLLSLAALTLALFSCAACRPAHADGLVRLPGHVPGTAISLARSAGVVPGQQAVRLAFVLPLRNQGALEQLISRLYDPKDPMYGRYLTPAEFQQQFGPSDADVAAVKAYASSMGLAVIGMSGNHTVIDVAGSASRINSAFSLQLRSYVSPSGRSFYAPSMNPAVPTGIAARIVGIVGLDNVLQFRPLLVHRNEMLAIGPEGSPEIGTGQSGSGLDPVDINKAYGLTGVTVNGSGVTPLDGTGQTLAVLEFDGYNASDITAYEKAYDLPSVPLTNVAVDGGITTLGSGQDEVTLDIELQAAVAPKAAGILVYEAPNNGTSWLDVLNKAATDNSAKSISLSWGRAEDSVTGDPTFYDDENAAFMQMASQGQSIFVSAGDNGAFTDTGEPTTPVADDPATTPYATSVGGTVLSINSDGSYRSESTWNEMATRGIGGGGGISTIWSIPSYQLPIVQASSDPELSKVMRNEPDVSLDADPDHSGYSIYEGGWTTVGGTSCAAPLWAAFTALLNQQRVASGLSTIGFVNPALYPIALVPSSYASDFHDIANLSNNGFYHAETGYDLATGLGSFNGVNLLADPLVGGLSLGTTITGQVTTPGVDGASAQPVVGATITESASTSTQVLQQATTDTSGDYTIAAPADQNVNVTADLAGYSAATQTVTTGDKGTTVSNVNLSLVVSPHTFPVVPGEEPYQMISSPYVYPVGETIAQILGDAAASPPVYYYSNYYNEYIQPPITPANTLTIGDGYWLENSQPASVSNDGTLVTSSSFQISLGSGWNMIGVPYNAAIPVSSITVMPMSTGTAVPYATALKSNTVSDFYTWQAGDPAYETIGTKSTDTLNPWEGYWIKSTGTTTLTIPNPGS